MTYRSDRFTAPAKPRSTTHTMFHNPVKIRACVSGRVSYLDIQDDAGNCISIHMPPEKARAIDAAYNAVPPAAFATSA